MWNAKCGMRNDSPTAARHPLREGEALCVLSYYRANVLTTRVKYFAKSKKLYFCEVGKGNVLNYIMLYWSN
jgi:hypothetical protein